MFDIVQFYKDYKIKYYTEGKNVSPGWVNIRCIHCDDSSNHLGWNLAEGYFNCWKCGKHDTIYTVGKLLGTTKEKTRSILAEYPSTSLYMVSNKSQSQARTLTLPGSSLSKYHREYLKKRNFDPDYIIDKYKITGTGPKEKWEEHDFELRIIIPIYWYNQLVSFQGRDITDKQELRYKGCPLDKSIMNYKDILYNHDNTDESTVVVVEGITDVWRMGDGFVSSLGSTLTLAQIAALTKFNQIFFLFDFNDEEAQNKAEKYSETLSSLGKRAEVVTWGNGTDPGDLSEKEVQMIRRELL
jgi:hypothetical protein